MVKKINKKNQSFVYMLLFGTLFISLFSLPTFAIIQNASVVDAASNSLMNIYWDTDAKAYGDGIDDAKIVVCSDSVINADSELGTKGATLAYVVGTNPSTLKNISVALDSTSSDDFEPFIGAGSCREANVDIQITRAYYPGRLFVVIDENSNSAMDSGDTFISTELLPLTGDKVYNLPGSYGYSTTNYNQTTGLIFVDVSSVTVRTGASSTAPLTGAGTSLDKLIIGLCSNQEGTTCSDTEVTNFDAGPISLDSSIITPSDTVSYQRYFVANGIPTDFCIGPELEVSVVTIPGPKYFSEEVPLTVTLTNNGNVNVTTDFDLNLSGTLIGAGVVQVPVTTNLSPGQSTIVPYTASAPLSIGSKTATATIDLGSISNCPDAIE